MDISTQACGEMFVLHHLLARFFECGKTSNVQNILETPGLRAMNFVFVRFCEQFIMEDKAQAAENLVRSCERIFGVDMEELFFGLIKGYGRSKNFEKVLDVFHRFEEKNIEPKKRTLVYISKVLSENNLEVPFKNPGNKGTDAKVPEDNFQELLEGKHSNIKSLE